MTRCIVSCAYSEGQNGRYLKYGKRLADSLYIYDHPLFTNPENRFKIWETSFPPESPTHRQLHYGFKFYAVQWAVKQGYKQILWLDAGAYATAPIEPIWQELDRRGVYVVADEEPLGEWISDQALDYFKTSRDEAMSLKLCGGAIVGLNLDSEEGVKFFERWGDLVKTKLFITAHSKYAPDKMKSLWVSDHDENLIVSSDPRFKGHRSDEACFSLVLREIGVEAVPLKEWNKVMRSGY